MTRLSYLREMMESTSLADLLDKNNGHIRGRFGSDEGIQKHKIMYYFSPRNRTDDVTIELTLLRPSDNTAVTSVDVPYKSLIKLAEHYQCVNTMKALYDHRSGNVFLMNDDLKMKLFSDKLASEG